MTISIASLDLSAADAHLSSSGLCKASAHAVQSNPSGINPASQTFIAQGFYTIYMFILYIYIDIDIFIYTYLPEYININLDPVGCSNHFFHG